MKKLKINRSILLTAIVMLVLGLLIGWLAKPSHAPETLKPETPETSEPTTWTCSMHPQIRQPESGQCPICGMDLIPLETEAAGEASPLEVKMSQTAMQLANVQTAVVGYGNAVKQVRLNGKVLADERLIFSQVSHLEGRVEQLSVNFTGEPVQRGQRLASIYSPELATAQQELFAAQKIKDTQPQLFTAAKEKLKNWKLTDLQIEAILAAGKPQERFPILADVGGIVLEKKVNLGDYVMRGMPIYNIVDLSRVWVLFDVYESDMAWVKVGSAVSFTIQSLPGENFTGKISFIDPSLNPETRVATARVEVANPGRRLKPEMFVNGVVKSSLQGKKESIVVPKSAVMWTGERSVVYVKNTSEQGVGFEMREVTLGASLGDSYVVKSGLQAGEEIAISGTFSIDAAAQLAGKPSMMNPEGGAAPTGHEHHGGSAAAPPLTPKGEPAAQPAQVSKQAKSAIEQLLEKYFPVKDALVASDLAAAKKQAATLKNAFEKTSMSLFTGEAHNHWMNHSGKAIEALNKLAAAKKVDDARTHFKTVSDQMIALAKLFGPFGQPVYVEHCPMAFDNKGADWLSEEEKILNPYFGEKMLRCGRVTEKILPK